MTNPGNTGEILLPGEKLVSLKARLGNKSLGLSRCLQMGLPVPAFLAVDADHSRELLENCELRSLVTEEAHRILAAGLYAVRSSALSEDGRVKSQAGRFKTLAGLPPEQLSGAIEAVLKDAELILEGRLEEFSLLIQEFWEPEYSGVTFTRSPLGGREMVVEYLPGRGENLVGGRETPQRRGFYWNQPPDLELLSVLGGEAGLEVFKRLETALGFPQDIEWGVKEGKLFILQTRPITSISAGQYREILYLENMLPREGKFYFARTELCEAAPRPTPATFYLLRKIYAQEGPIAEVYEKEGIVYQDTGFLLTLGSRLYVDKEKELQSLLPAYSCLSDSAYTPQPVQASGSWQSFKNLMKLNSLKLNKDQDDFWQLKKKWEAESPPAPALPQALDAFLQDYRQIFAVNLRSGFAVKKLELALGKDKSWLPSILGAGGFFLPPLEAGFDFSGLKGNSLELSEVSAFQEMKANGGANEEFEKWWKTQGWLRKIWLKTVIVQALRYQRLRELGRALTVKSLAQLRAALLETAKNLDFSTPDHIFYASMEEVLAGQAEEAECRKRKAEYQSYSAFALPSEVMSSPRENRSEKLGIAPGTARGKLLGIKELEAENAGSPVILYAEILAPGLAVYFPRIKGIAAESGGMLSHLAILAREAGIPVVANFVLRQSGIEIGEEVLLNGSSGEIIKA